MAVHVYNHTPLRHTQCKMPLENLQGKQPDISYFQVFGCEAWVYIPQQNRQNKLLEKSIMCTVVGYEIGTKAYKFVTTDNHLIIAPQAIFWEKRECSRNKN